MGRLSDRLMTLGIPHRQPSASEMDFFGRSGIPGYAAPDNRVVLNPRPPQGVDLGAVAENEAARVYMRQNSMQPGYSLTPGQEAALRGTPYENSPDHSRQTIAARLLSGDPSARQSTPEQEVFVRDLLARMQMDALR